MLMLTPYAAADPYRRGSVTYVQPPATTQAAAKADAPASLATWQWVALALGGIALGAFTALHHTGRQLRGADLDPRPHYAQRKRERRPVWFVNPEDGEFIELDHATAKYRRDGEKEFRGPSMLQTIASEARSPAEYARRADAWNAAEAKPLSIVRLAKAYRGAAPGTTARLIREAQEARIEGRERLWSKMSRGLRGR